MNVNLLLLPLLLLLCVLIVEGIGDFDTYGPIDSVETALVEKLPFCPDTPTKRKCTNVLRSESLPQLEFCIHRGRLHVDENDCDWPNYSFSDALHILEGKTIIFIGDSRVRYSYATALYWLENGIWPSSVKNTSHLSIANEKHWMESFNSTHAWNAYYRGAEAVMHGNLRIENLRGRINFSPADQGYTGADEAWYYHNARTKVSMMYFNYFGGDYITGFFHNNSNLHHNHPAYTGSRGREIVRLHFEKFIEMISSEYNMTHLFLETGWHSETPRWNATDPHSIYSTSTLHDLAERRNFEIIYNNGFGRLSKGRDTFLPGTVSYLNMWDFCEKMISFIGMQYIMWDGNHYLAFVNRLFFQAILSNMDTSR